jgi:hypothetical protein
VSKNEARLPENRARIRLSGQKYKLIPDYALEKNLPFVIPEMLYRGYGFEVSKK